MESKGGAKMGLSEESEMRLAEVRSGVLTL